MTFSIIIPVYNVAQYLPQCIESVLRQDCDDYEVICVDDGSTDDSYEVLEEYAKKDVRFTILRQANSKQGAARNAGLKIAKGDYILFLDSDDWLEQNTLRILKQQLNSEDVLCFRGQRYFESTEVYEPADIIQTIKGIQGWEYYNQNALTHRNFAFVCIVLQIYRRQFLIENQLYFTPGIFHEDNLFIPLVYYYAQKVSVISDCLYNYRIHSNSTMTTRNMKHQKDLLYVANTLAHFFIPKNDIDKTVVYRALTHHYQAVFQQSNRHDDATLRKLVDWKSYLLVSRTKLRHRIQYTAMRISPTLYRLMTK